MLGQWIIWDEQKSAIDRKILSCSNRYIEISNCSGTYATLFENGILHMAMAFMSKLTLGQLVKPTKASTPEMERRNKLLVKLQEQLAIATAMAKGDSYAATKKGWGTDAEGKRVRVDLPRRSSAWFFREGDKVILLLRYGASVLTLGAKGQKSIVLPSMDAVPTTLQTVIDAVKNGELDSSMAEVVGARKARNK